MKDKKTLTLVALVTIMLVLLLMAKSEEKKPLSWEPTFINTDYNPYGTLITYKLLKDIFDRNVRETRKPIYNTLKDNYDIHISGNTDDEYGDEEHVYVDEDEPVVEHEPVVEEEPVVEDLVAEAEHAEEEYDAEEESPETTVENYGDVDLYDTTSYIFINKDFNLDKVDLECLMQFVGMGNNVFISTETLPTILTEKLGIDINHNYQSNADSTYILADYPSKKYSFSSLSFSSKLELDSCKYPVSVLANNQTNDTVFVALKYGKGTFYLHLVPTAFTNLYQLKPNSYDFAYRCLSYLPQSSIVLWDEYQTQGAIGDTSPLRVILESYPLRVALYITLVGLLLFMIFRAKRTQRAIPVIVPPVNSSIEFLGTISNMYYQQKDFSALVEMRHSYLLDYIRKQFFMSTEHIDNDFIKVLSAKSGVESNVLNELFVLYNRVNSMDSEAFMQYNSLLETFYNKTKANK